MRAPVAVAATLAALSWAPSTLACRGRAYCMKADANLGYMLLRDPATLRVVPDGGKRAVGGLPSTGPMSLLSFAGGFGFGSDRGLFFPFVYVSIDLPFNEPYPARATVGGVDYTRRRHGTFHEGIDLAGIGVGWPVAREWLFTGQARPGYAHLGTIGGANLESPDGDASADRDAFVVHVDLRLCRTRTITACFWLAPTPWEGTWLGSVTGGLGGHW